MRIILSRKGWDSKYGGGASPILEDRAMVSLPIPTGRAPKRYRQIDWRGRPLGDVTRALSKGKVPGIYPAHLDPDLDPGMLPRQPGWRGAFGQVGAAQSHLANRGVGPGDLFLFFGWFRDVVNVDGEFRYRRGAPDMHVLFGWLQVGEVLAITGREAEFRRAYPWLADHPHLMEGVYGTSNTVYVASDRLVVDGRDMGPGRSAPSGRAGLPSNSEEASSAPRSGLAGAGVFGRYHEGLRLTRPEGPRSAWQLPHWFLPETGPTLSYHEDATRWTRQADGSCIVHSVPKGQEFVMDVADRLADVAAWLQGLLDGVESRQPMAEAG